MPGNVVQLEVSDNGVGMTPDTLRKIFDPFFTTKVTGRGLGLSAVIGIVKGHHGGLRVESEAGRRTTFKIVFPVSNVKHTDIASKPLGSHPAHYEGCVLIVDDEADVREVVTDMMDDVGVRTIVAQNGEEALEMYKAKWSEIDLILLDLSMPGMGGKEAFKKMKAINPRAKVVLTSGYSESEVTEELKELGLTGFIQKPYRYDKLKETILRYLAGRQSS
jgi:CheY-like chemotaxis protein